MIFDGVVKNEGGRGMDTEGRLKSLLERQHGIALATYNIDAILVVDPPNNVNERLSRRISREV